MVNILDTMLEIPIENRERTEMENKHSYDALAVVCSDGDYHNANTALFDHLGFGRPDEVKLPAAVKNLADDPSSAKYQVTLESIAKLIELHGQKPDFPVILMLHRNCGGYEYKDTKEQILSDMQKAKHALQTINRPIRFIISEVIDRANNSIPQTIKYMEFNLDNDNITEREIFTYTNGRNSSSG